MVGFILSLKAAGRRSVRNPYLRPGHAPIPAPVVLFNANIVPAGPPQDLVQEALGAALLRLALAAWHIPWQRRRTVQCRYLLLSTRKLWLNVALDLSSSSYCILMGWRFTFRLLLLLPPAVPMCTRRRRLVSLSFAQLSRETAPAVAFLRWVRLDGLWGLFGC